MSFVKFPYNVLKMLNESSSRTLGGYGSIAHEAKPNGLLITY